MTPCRFRHHWGRWHRRDAGLRERWCKRCGWHRIRRSPWRAFAFGWSRFWTSLDAPAFEVIGFFVGSVVFSWMGAVAAFLFGYLVAWGL